MIIKKTRKKIMTTMTIKAAKGKRWEDLVKVKNEMRTIGIELEIDRSECLQDDVQERTTDKDTEYREWVDSNGDFIRRFMSENGN